MGSNLFYEYDFGDGWQHELLLEEVLAWGRSVSADMRGWGTIVRPKTVEGRTDLQSFSKHSRTPITRGTMRSLTGSAILFLSSFLRME